MSTYVVIRFSVQAQKLASFKSMLINVKENLPKVAGCLNVRIFESTSSNGIFTLVEEWIDRGHHSKHVENLISSGAWSELKAHLTDEPISDYYSSF